MIRSHHSVRSISSHLINSWCSSASPLPRDWLSCPPLQWREPGHSCVPGRDRSHWLHDQQTPAASTPSWGLREFLTLCRSSDSPLNNIERGVRALETRVVRERNVSVSHLILHWVREQSVQYPKQLMFNCFVCFIKLQLTPLCSLITSLLNKIAADRILHGRSVKAWKSKPL